MDDANMQDLPEYIQQIRRSLKPYIKTRHEVNYMRRVLAVHLESHVKIPNGKIGRPLSLVDSAAQVEQCHSAFQGIQADYFRSLRANLAVREEHERLRKLHIGNIEAQQPDPQLADLETYQDSPALLDSFLHSITEERKYQRLKIIQASLDKLALMTTADADSHNPQLMFEEVDSIPKIPGELLHHHDRSEHSNLSGVANHLEKSVLRAKFSMRQEQKVLAQLKGSAQTLQEICPEQRIHALETTYNELIAWIEAELAKAGDDPSKADNTPALASPGTHQSVEIDGELARVRDQYARYVQTREALIKASTSKLEAALSGISKPTPSNSTYDGLNASSAKSHVIYPLLEQLLAVSNAQKALIQQKSHFTISLAKQLKDVHHELDRLASESHLLPAYPNSTPSTRRNSFGSPVLVNANLLGHETPETIDNARAWTFASEAAGKATEDYVSEQLELGKVSLYEAEEALRQSQCVLMGTSDGDHGSADNIWGQLNGNLGAIKGN